MPTSKVQELPIKNVFFIISRLFSTLPGRLVKITSEQCKAALQTLMTSTHLGENFSIKSLH